MIVVVVVAAAAAAALALFPSSVPCWLSAAPALAVLDNLDVVVFVAVGFVVGATVD